MGEQNVRRNVSSRERPKNKFDQFISCAAREPSTLSTRTTFLFLFFKELNFKAAFRRRVWFVSEINFF